ncbi:DUF1743 domain-containing protein [Candidatus Magnetomoraceae bacterium gMMP-15]
MRIYLGFDDTDTVNSDRGTGKLARWFESELPEECKMSGVVRQQLLVHDSIPYTSHNSSACMIIEAEKYLLETIILKAVHHVEKYFIDGSDPGICAAYESDSGLGHLIEFGLMCTKQITTQKEALKAASKAHLSGHGGTNDGIIGAAAAVGLTASGWCGRFIEFGRLREFPNKVKVSEIEDKNIHVISLDRDANLPFPNDQVITKGWLRPRLLGHEAVLMVTPKGKGIWESLGEKRHKAKRQAE